MDSRTSVRNLSETLHSLLGLKAHLTSNWVRSVCDIIKKSEKPTELKLDDSDIRAASDTKLDDDSGTAISKVKEELAELTSYVNQLNVQRRQVLNEFLDLKGNIRVFCRIRPITLSENFCRLRPVVAADASNVLLKVADNKSKSYSFDRVFPPGSSQDEVFSEIEPVIKSVLDGYNACIFAYGQTGTGKTFTMEGSPVAPGVVPRAIDALFKQAAESNHAFLISFSMLEIYMGNIRDLLVPKPTKSTDPLPPCLTIQTDPKGGIEIDNLVTIQVNDFNQALRLYRLGCRYRSTASTDANTTSSRSHCMIRIAMTCYNAPERERETNKIWLVDLGGSERVLKTKAWGKRLDEGKAINLSLSALGDVINALQRKKRHVPYRNSKLTQVLKDSLGDDSKTFMLVHVSPKEEDLCETLCSLNFATRVKSIHLGNEDSTEARKLKEVTMENLQKKMKQIENERLHAKTEIEKLKKKLEILTGVNLSPKELVEASNLFTEESMANKDNGNIAHPSTALPRFMRPTVCSRRKSGTSYQPSELKNRLPLRRTSSCHRAESVTIPVKNHSENNSEHSIVSCLAGVETRYGVDSATECSQDTSEIDVIDIRVQKRALKTSKKKKATNSHGPGNRNRQANKANPVHFSKVDNWLHLQKADPIISGNNHRKKRVLGIPLPEKQWKSNEQRKSETRSNEETCIHKLAIQVSDHVKKDSEVHALNAERPVSEVMINKPMPTLKDLFKEDSLSEFISLSQITEEEKRMPIQESIDSLSIEDSEYSVSSSVDEFCAAFYRYQEQNKEIDVSLMPAVDAETRCIGECSLSDATGSTINLRGISSVSISLSEVGSCNQQLLYVSDIEDISEVESCNRQFLHVSDVEDNGKDPDTFLEYSKKVTYVDPLKLRSQRALFTNYAQQKDPAKTFKKTDRETQTTGVWHIIKQKTEILWASTLLGFGWSNLGLEPDFFYGLTN